MRIRKLLFVGGIFAAGVVGGWTLRSGGLRPPEVRAAPAFPPPPVAAGCQRPLRRRSRQLLPPVGRRRALSARLAARARRRSPGERRQRPRAAVPRQHRSLRPASGREACRQPVRPAGRHLVRAREGQRDRDDRPQLLGVPRRAGAVPGSRRPHRRWAEHGLHQQVPRAPRRRDREHAQDAAPARALLGSGARGAPRAARRRATGPRDVADDETFARRMRPHVHENRGLLEAQVNALRNVPDAQPLAVDQHRGRLRPARRVRHRPRRALRRDQGQRLPADAPVSIPHIWGLEYTGWLQWGANTNSVMERNIGQALGVGALFDPKTFESTVRLENLHQLEGLAYKITPPKWPDTLPRRSTAHAPSAGARSSTSTAPAATRRSRPTARCASTSCSRSTRSAPTR